MAGTRRQGRELALQILYYLDVQPELPVAEALARFHAAFAAAADGDEAAPSAAGAEPADLAEVRDFAERLVRGVVAERAAIDQRITRASRNWRLERMARVDRNLLRIAVHELGSGGDVPAKVAINEAIEIAKRFGAQETPAFVNGILDRVLEELGQ
jgi:N utilization substance protein B